MDRLVAYSLSITPGIALAALILALLPRRGAERDLRLGVHLLLFVLLRDAMTPARLWKIGAAPGFFLRLPDEAGLLVSLAVVTGGLVAAILALEPDLRALVVWRRGSLAAGVTGGLLGAALVGAPVLALSAGIPIDERGGPVARSLWPALLLFALVGNLYEETLFRGFLQGRLEPALGPARAALLSGLGFALGHTLLAAAVTSTGWPVLVFTLYEGLICAALRARWGVAASTIAHGGGIFLCASGLP